MKVRATQTGFYDNLRRRVGDVFTIQSEQEFSSRWMVRVDPSTPEKVTTSQAALDAACDPMRPIGATRSVCRSVTEDEAEGGLVSDFDPYASEGE
jgi:hypothetical protein